MAKGRPDKIRFFEKEDITLPWGLKKIAYSAEISEIQP